MTVQHPLVHTVVHAGCVCWSGLAALNVTQFPAVSAIDVAKPVTGPKYKLYYYNGQGRGELSRLLFAFTGIPYEDVRLSDVRARTATHSLSCK